MKKLMMLAAFVVGLSASAALAGLTPGTGVQDSPHDMTAITYGNGDDQGRICAFCHTPHHAIDSVAAPNHTYLPLWAHTPNNDVGFLAYGTGDGNIPFSPTLERTLEPDILVGPSRLCFSCHDGVIAVDQHYGTVYPGSVPLAGMDNFVPSDPLMAQLGSGIAAIDSLANDHPIGFDYVAIAAATSKGVPNSAAAAGTDGYINPATSTYGITGYTNTNAPGMMISDRLFGGTIMTCATCHDVHNRKNATNIAAPTVNKFVLAPQDKSALCQTCHIK